MPFNLQEKKQINFMDIQSNIIYGSTTTIYIYIGYMLLTFCLKDSLEAFSSSISLI